ncbi:hypothetical protein [Polycladidibacter stylochi]|uniref:hypothetical protein n=1 Tax=Polycladidibacter stylochi TaxID=1807766 RepID=UPI0008353F4C|nr:hypothetical protein [Pseudovibrio stylochi]
MIGKMKYLIFPLVLFIGIFLGLALVVVDIGVLNISNTWVETSCSPQGNTCLKVLKESTSGVDYTTTTTIVWEKYFFWFSSLPANYLVFDPETYVDVIWLSEDSVKFAYEGGDYKLIGAKPQDISFEFERNG